MLDLGGRRAATNRCCISCPRQSHLLWPLCSSLAFCSNSHCACRYRSAFVNVHIPTCMYPCANFQHPLCIHLCTLLLRAHLHPSSRPCITVHARPSWYAYIEYPHLLPCGDRCPFQRALCTHAQSEGCPLCAALLYTKLVTSSLLCFCWHALLQRGLPPCRVLQRCLKICI